MSNKTRMRMSIATAIMSVALLLAFVLFFGDFVWYVRVALCVAVVLVGVVTELFLFFKKEKESKLLFLLLLLCVIGAFVFWLFRVTGLSVELSDIEHIRQFILQSGGLGILICFLLIIINVVILPAPAFVFYLAVSAVYGSFGGFLISYLGTVFGSLIAFTIGKKLGKRAVAWIAGKEQTEKYAKKLNKTGKVPFLIMQLLPFFPDDVLCMVAGLSSMSYRYVTLALLLIKPFYIATVCVLGTGDIIPFHGWGIPVWIAIFAVILVFCVFYFKNQDKIDTWMSETFVNKHKK